MPMAKAAESKTDSDVGKMSFEDQYIYYKEQEKAVLGMARSNIINGLVVDDGLDLYDFRDCFESSDFHTYYEFINAKGKEKLKAEWINIWREFELDKFA